MKTLQFLLISLCAFLVKAQTAPLTTPRHQASLGTYFKDIDNEMDKFVGTWQYTTPTTTLTIVLEKKTHIYDGKFYEDFLNGGYSYVENGVEQINTLPLLSDPTNANGDHSTILGRLKIPSNMFLACNDCNPNEEERFMLHFTDPDRLYLALGLVIRYIPTNAGEPEKMRATLIATSGGILPYENAPTSARVPYGEYIMTKQ